MFYITLNLFSVTNTYIISLMSFFYCRYFLSSSIWNILLLMKNKYQKRSKNNTSLLILNILGIDIKILSLVFTLKPDIKR